MRNFTYNNLNEITICTALPALKTANGTIDNTISLHEQTTADLGFLASQKIIQAKNIDTNQIGVLIFLTKTPDYRGPATAMVLQNRLIIPQDCIVYDSPTGNGGFENALNLGASLLSATHKKYAIIVFGDTISKQLSNKDINELNFQDGASSLLIEKGLGSFPFNMSTITLSNQWSSFMFPSGGFRENGLFFKNLKSKRINQQVDHLHIDFKKIFSSTKKELSSIITKVLELLHLNNSKNVAILINLIDSNLEKELERLLQTEGYTEKVYLSSHNLPQTMASTIPLMIERIVKKEKSPLLNIISISLGEGLCLNISSLQVRESNILETIYSDDYYTDGNVIHEM